MLIEFKLTMPNIGSWNGRWSGERKYYAKVVNIGRTKEKEQLGREIVDRKSFYYNFGDGWGMSIKVRQVDSKEAARIRRKSSGFCGYEWAIDSILKHKKIIC